MNDPALCCVMNRIKTGFDLKTTNDRNWSLLMNKYKKILIFLHAQIMWSDIQRLLSSLIKASMFQNTDKTTGIQTEKRVSFLLFGAVKSLCFRLDRIDERWNALWVRLAEFCRLSATIFVHFCLSFLTTPCLWCLSWFPPM